MIAPSRRQLRNFARRNYIHPTLRCNWHVRYGFDPIVACYEIGAQYRRWSLMCALLVAFLAFGPFVSYFWPDLLQATRFVVPAVGFFGIVFLYRRFKNIDQLRWGHRRSKVTDFSADLAQFVDMHSWYLGGIASSTPQEVQSQVTKNLVNFAKQVVAIQRCYALEKTEEKLDYVSDMAKASDHFKRAFEISKIFSLTDTDGHGSYYRSAEKELRKEQPHLFREGGLELKA